MDKLIRDMRDAAKVILALPPYSRAIVSPAVQLAVMAQKAADELEKRRWIPVEERLPEAFEDVWAACKMDGRENWTIKTIYDPWISCPWGVFPVLESGKAHVYAWMPNNPPEPPEEDSNGKIH